MATPEHGGRAVDANRGTSRTETKSALKTTEFLVVAVIAGILVSAALITGGPGGREAGDVDEFIARQAWLYVAIVAGAYAVARGLAKSGSVTHKGDER